MALTELKALADDKFLMLLTCWFLSLIGYKTLWGKRENCWLPVFSPFLTMFSEGFFNGVVKTRDCAVTSQVSEYLGTRQSLRAIRKIQDTRVQRNDRYSALYLVMNEGNLTLSSDIWGGGGFYNEKGYEPYSLTIIKNVLCILLLLLQILLYLSAFECNTTSDCLNHTV